MLGFTTLSLALAAGFSFVASAHESDSIQLGTVLAGNPKLNTLSKLFEIDPNLFDASQDPIDTTFFAPSDDAFREFLRITRGSSDFLENKATRFRVFKDLLNYHTIRGGYKLKELRHEDTRIVRTHLENTTYVRVDNENQVVRIIQENGTDHVYGGYNEPVSIIGSDMEMWNGYVHVVDGFLKLPGPLLQTLDELNLEAFIRACDDAGTMQEFAALDDVTIFVPANVNIPDNYSIIPEDILKYHIVQGNVLYSNSLQKSATKVDSLYGARLIITRQGDDLYVNDAKVIAEDIIINSGVIHVIERALDPLGMNFKSTKKENDCTCTDGKCTDANGKSCTLEPVFAEALVAGKSVKAISAGTIEDSRKNIIRCGIMTAAAALFIYAFF